MPHKPVLVEEVIQILSLEPGEIVVDATMGSGGHSQKILEKIQPGGTLIGLDQDPAAIERSGRLFEGKGGVILRKANFTQIAAVLSELNIDLIHAVMIDTGFSSDQLEDPSRGFSFEREGPLDMRLDPDGPVTAYDLLYKLPKESLANIFWEYAQERKSRQFAQAIVNARGKRQIQTTQDLVEVLSEALPGSRVLPKQTDYKFHGRHFATRIFQALRIAVNDELKVLEEGIQNFWKVLSPGGRMAVISFHSLEDRIVKQAFRSWEVKGEGALLVKKPVVPGRDEMRNNSRSRSAKLRGIMKL